MRISASAPGPPSRLSPGLDSFGSIGQSAAGARDPDRVTDGAKQGNSSKASGRLKPLLSRRQSQRRANARRNAASWDRWSQSPSLEPCAPLQKRRDALLVVLGQTCERELVDFHLA